MMVDVEPTSLLGSRAVRSDQTLRDVEDSFSRERSISQFLGDLCYLCPGGLDLNGNIEMTAGDQSS